MNKKKSIGLLLFLVCVTMVSGYLILYVPLKEKQICSGVAVAIIESVEDKVSKTKGNSGDARVFRCQYSYIVNDVKYVGYEYSQQFNNSWTHRVGNQVNILYNEQDPSEFVLSQVISHYCKWFFVPFISGGLTVLTFFGILTERIKET